MKYKYCGKCRKSYIRSRLEGPKCIYCGAECLTLDVKRNAAYYIGYIFMVAGAVSVLIPRIAVVSAPAPYTYLGIAAVIAGAFFVVMGSSKMARTAAEMALADEDDEEE